MEVWLTHSSFGLVLLALLIAGLGVPIPEEPLLLAAGVLAHTDRLPLPLVILACSAAILLSDFSLFSIARHHGPRLLDRPFLRRLLPPARRASLERMLARRGDAIVFAARHIPGLRAPIFALAGMHHMRRARFLLWDGLGLCITAPLTVCAGWLGSAHVDLVRRAVARTEHWIAAVAITGLAVAWLVVALRKRRRIDRPDEPGPGPTPPSTD